MRHISMHVPMNLHVLISTILVENKSKLYWLKLHIAQWHNQTLSIILYVAIAVPLPCRTELNLFRRKTIDCVWFALAVKGSFTLSNHWRKRVASTTIITRRKAVAVYLNYLSNAKDHTGTQVFYQRINVLELSHS